MNRARTAPPHCNPSTVGDDLPPPLSRVDYPVRGTVWVIAPMRRRRRQAACTCGWTGPQRWLLASATTSDALLHARDFGCRPGDPLVIAALPLSGSKVC